MEQKEQKLYRSAPLLENKDLEQRLEKKLNGVNSFNNHRLCLINKSLAISFL